MLGTYLVFPAVSISAIAVFGVAFVPEARLLERLGASIDGAVTTQEAMAASTAEARLRRRAPSTAPARATAQGGASCGGSSRWQARRCGRPPRRAGPPSTARRR